MSTTCPACATELPGGARFCLQCGTPLAVRCSSCSTELPAGARFCLSCGQPVAGTEAAPSGITTPEAPLPAREERRLITVLFADLAGFTAHAERSDPEDVKARLSTYHRRAREDVERFGGRIEKLMGDGVFAVFGVPIAHEDDRERAVRAALRIQESVVELNEERPELELSVRIGVTTGEAIVQLDPDVPDREGIVGDVVNTASRLEGVAAPGTVVVDERTHRGSVDSIEFDELAPVAVKGKAEPLRIWRAVAPRSRFGTALEDEHTTPFLGRDAELELLVSTFDRTARDGRLQLVTILGEPGVGKSRLLHEFWNVIDDRPDLVWWRQGRCLPYGEGITFWALGEIVKAQAGILDTDDQSVVADKLRRAVVAQIEDAEAGSWVLARLESIVGPPRPDAQPPGRELFAALTRLFEALADRHPLVLIIEDLQWADPTLLEFLDHLTEWAADSPILVVVTARPELLDLHSDWAGGKRNATSLALSPLTDGDTARIIAALLDQTVIDARIQQALLERCGGNPLYATEFVRYLSDRGLLDRIDLDPELDIPDTIRGLIAARVDLLDPADKAVLRAASVVGRVFWVDTVAEACRLGLDETQARLRSLAMRELVRPVRQSSMAGHEEWTFTHALVTDVAYSQIPRSERSLLHRLVAAWIERTAGDRMPEVSELLAHHYGRIVELDPQAIDEIRRPAHAALMAAGERVAGADGPRAGGYFGRAVDLAEGPAERARARLERSKLFSDYDAVDAQEQDLLTALDEARAAGDAGLEAEVLFQLSGTRWYRGDSEGRRTYMESAYQLVEGDPESELATRIISQQVFDAWVATRNEYALDLIERERVRILRAAPLEVRTRMLELEGGVRLALGDPAGLEMMSEALEVYKDLNDTPRTNSAYNNLATNALLYWPAEKVARLMDEAIAMCLERGYVPHSEWSRMTRIESWFPLGRWEEAVADLRGIIEADGARGGSRVSADCTGWLALLGHFRSDASLTSLLDQEMVEQALKTEDTLYQAAGLSIALLIAMQRGAVAEAGDWAGRFIGMFGDTVEYLDFYLGLVAEPLVELGMLDELSDMIHRARPVSAFETGRLRQAEAVLAQASGNHEEAVRRAGEAVEIHESLGHVFDPVRARILAARSLIALGRDDEAAELLEMARNGASRMRARLLLDEIDALLGGERDAAATGT